MKNIFVTLSSLCALTISAHGITSAAVKQPKTIEVNDPKTTALLNNFYGALGTMGNTSSWITNQSVTDHKYYSYDMEDAFYYLSDGKTYAYQYFTVDNLGTLNFTAAEKTLSSSDQNTLNNTKSQIEQNKKVTMISDDYNPYSKSIYNDKYFSGGFNDWQFIQLGATEKHIDLSKSGLQNYSLIENYNNLSENLGLYYIVKALQQGKITQTVADDFANYFISQTTLATKINPALTDSIIELLFRNKTIYNFISSAPFYLSDKNYSLDFVFDDTNKLVELAYNNWSNTKDANENVGYSVPTEYNPYTDNSQVIKLVKWSDYAKSWDVFTSMYPNFNFDSNSNFGVGTAGGSSDAAALTKTQVTANITTQNKTIYSVHAHEDSIPIPHIPSSSIDISAQLDFYHDDNYIYFQWFRTVKSVNFGPSCSFSCNLNNIMFHNIMN